MLCEVCNKNQAFIFYEERINNQVRKMHLCQECAAKQGISDVFSQPFLNISNLLSGLGESNPPQVAADAQVVCGSCQTTYEQFIKSGLLGCCQCYQYFENSLKPLLRRIHGSTQHVGKDFAVTKKPELCDTEISELDEKLKTAVKNEEFELAAELRDRIRSLKNQCNSKDPKGQET